MQHKFSLLGLQQLSYVWPFPLLLFCMSFGCLAIVAWRPHTGQKLYCFSVLLFFPEVRSTLKKVISLQNCRIHKNIISNILKDTEDDSTVPLDLIPAFLPRHSLQLLHAGQLSFPISITVWQNIIFFSSYRLESTSQKPIQRKELLELQGSWSLSLSVKY